MRALGARARERLKKGKKDVAGRTAIGKVRPIIRSMKRPRMQTRMRASRYVQRNDRFRSARGEISRADLCGLLLSASTIPALKPISRAISVVATESSVATETISTEEQADALGHEVTRGRAGESKYSRVNKER